jgi:hypothetical protein
MFLRTVMLRGSFIRMQRSRCAGSMPAIRGHFRVEGVSLEASRTIKRERTST